LEYEASGLRTGRSYGWRGKRRGFGEQRDEIGREVEVKVPV